MLASRKSKISSEGLFCNYQHRVCMQNRLEGYEYCVRHILEDKSAPYKQCNYVFPKNGKRCPNAAPRTEKKDGFCFEHRRRAALMRHKNASKPKVVETPETILEELEHYTISGDTEESQLLSETSQFDPTTNSIYKKTSNFHSGSDKMLAGFASETESDKEVPLVDQTWRGDCGSDAESIDSEQEDPLKHAGVYSAEEVALITRDKLIKLQSLYIDQFKRLQHVLKEKRRKYLQGVKAEKETMGSIHGTARTTNEEIHHYDKLKSLTRYHKRHGQELLLYNKAKQRRLALTEGVPRQPNHARCIQHSKTDRCTEGVLPLSKYCRKHILHDPHQVLYRICNYPGSNCKHPVVPVVDGPTCILHLLPPPFPGSPVRDSKSQQVNKGLEDKPSNKLQPMESADSLCISSTDIADDNLALQEMQGLFQELVPEVVVPCDNLSNFRSDLLSGNHMSPDTDVEK